MFAELGMLFEEFINKFTTNIWTGYYIGLFIFIILLLCLINIIKRR